MSRANKERLYVVSYKEIFLIFLTFTLILIFLFPKDILKEKLLQEDDNYDLSVLYLQNIMKHDKLDEKLVMLLAERSARIGKHDLALRLTRLLLHSQNKKIQKEAVLLRYQLLKDNYFYLKSQKNTKALRAVKMELVTLFHKIMKEHYYTQKDLLQWYAESLFLSQNSYSLKILEELLQRDDKDIKLYEEGFYLAQKMGDKKEALRLLHKLEAMDKKHRDKWLLSEYYFLLNNEGLKEVESFLIAQAKESYKWKKELARFYMAHSIHKKAFMIYKGLFLRAKNFEDKKRYFISAVRSLEAGNYMKEASDFAARYQAYFIHSKVMRTYILKLYLRANELQKATRYSKEILLKGDV